MYKYPGVLVIVFTMALFAGCAVRPAAPMLAPETRIDMRDVSFLPPPGHDWYIVTHEPVTLELGAIGSGEDETYALQAGYFQLPGFDNAEDLVEFLRPQVQLTQSPRFTPIEFRITPRNIKTLSCAEVRYEVEDSQAVKRTERKGPMRLHAITIYCLHPWEENVALHIAYTNRRYKEDGKPELQRGAQVVFESLRIEREHAQEPRRAEELGSE